MPAGLLLSLRTAPRTRPSQRGCCPQIPLRRWQDRPMNRFGQAPWALPILRHALSVGAATPSARIPASEPYASRAIPEVVGAEDALGTSPPSRQFQATFAPPFLRVLPPAPLTGTRPVKVRPQPHSRQSPARACTPCLERGASFLPVSLLFRGVSSRRFLRPPPCRRRSSPLIFLCRTSFAAVRLPCPFQARRLCAQPAFFQPSRHLCAKKNDFVKKNANPALLPSSLPDKSACSPPERPLKTGVKNRKNQEITDFFRQSTLTSPAKHVSVFSIAAGLQAVLGITCGVSVTFERVFFHVQVHLCWEPPLGRY